MCILSVTSSRIYMRLPVALKKLKHIVWLTCENSVRFGAVVAGRYAMLSLGASDSDALKMRTLDWAVKGADVKQVPYVLYGLNI